MTLALFAITMILLPSSTLPQSGGKDAEQDKAAIVQTALDYAEGYYGGDPSRMARAVSPYLSKRGLLTVPNVPPFLVQMNADMLIDASNGAKLASTDRHIITEVLEVNKEVASARVFTAQFNDYLHLIKRDGKWQILNVLWHQPPPSTPPSETVKGEVERAVKEYASALFSADGPRVLTVLHPVANLRALAQPPQGRPRVVREQNPDSLAAALAAGQVKPAGQVEDAQITVQGVDVSIAAAKLVIGPTTTYLHLALQDGKWRIVNALAYPPAPSTVSMRIP